MIPNEAQIRYDLLLVDDHAIVREGLKRVLEPTAGEWRVTEAATATQALDCLHSQRIDVAIVDLSMPGMSGFELIQRIRDGFPAVKVLVLSSHAEEQYALRALKAGANGYVTKDTAAAELVVAVRKVAAGETFVSASMAERVVQQVSGQTSVPVLGKLSDREREILRLIVSGQRPTDIANTLNLSVKTVSTHKSRIQEKLNLPSTAALVHYGLQQGLEESPPKVPIVVAP
jgi:DNA-binding NarL/FixJ family response regulator